MKALWACEPFHQDNTRVQGMYHLFRQLVGQSTNIEVGFIVTRTESDLNWAFKVPQKERFTVYPRKILKRALQKAKSAVDDKKIHVVDHETMSNKKTVDCPLTLADTRGTKHLEKVIETCKQVNAELTVFHKAQVIYKWSLYEPNRNILSYRRKVNRTQSRIEQACKVIIASEFSPTTDFILKTAIKVKADLIVVAARVGSLIALMGGSTTRQIIRESTRPVLVLI